MDIVTARRVARVAAGAHPHTVALSDLINGATAARHGFTVLTLTMKDFARLDVVAIDPFKDLPADI